MNDPEAFARFLASMPVALRASMQSGDEASTAFYNAIRAGWTEEELTHDAAYRVRGGKMGAGWVITGLRNLAKNPPIRSGKAPRNPYVPEHRELIPEQWAAERAALIRRAIAEGVSEEVLAKAMEQLVLEQRTSTQDKA